MTEPGQIRIENDLRGVRFERRYDAAPAEVWAALTEPERLARWFARAELDLRVGGHYSLWFDPDDATQQAQGEVLALEPGRVLELSWRHPEHADSVVRFELEPDGAGTILVLDHRALPAEAAPGHAGGWHAHLDSLAAHLGEGGDADWWGRYRELAPVYEAQEAALTE
jgi:uncharacterized protein YndB with AHSA1/START domain